MHANLRVLGKLSALKKHRFFETKTANVHALQNWQWGVKIRFEKNQTKNV